jgi:transcription elongation factor Elf1
LKDKSEAGMLPTVECLCCGKAIEFPQYVVDSQKYKGQVRCKKCNARLHIKKVGKEIQEYELIEKGERPPIKIIEVRMPSEDKK